jgi:trans-2,3-dihydro-3-hydroxyanthranilate isomerase
MAEIEFHTLDVFTDRVFGGNPLAVFPDGDGIDDDTMRRIARELNLSETVFVAAPREAGDFRLRIFTPAVELPFAGHPTVGTAVLLAHLGRVPLDGGRADIVFEEGVGPVPVSIRAEDGRPVFAQLTTSVMPEVGPPAPPPEVLAELLSLTPGDLGGSLGAANASAGVGFLFVSVRDRAALARARIDQGAWERHLRDAWGQHVYVMTDDAGEADLRSRMFAPSMGIAEDPATGGAAAALIALLATRDGHADGAYAWTVEQGVEMGRPSRLHLEADVRRGRIAAARVGGTAVRVSRGWMNLG